jgi:hypothetical protein
MYTTKPASFAYVDPEISPWQPDVYSLAGFLAKQLNVSAICDIGCGKASKLLQLKSTYGFHLTGFDLPEHVEYCQAKSPGDLWYAHNAETPFDQFILTTPRVFICADFLEHVEHPEYALQFIKRNLTSLAIFSTPERVIAHGYDHPGPPCNPHHVREWSFKEFADLLTSHGFTIHFHGLTRSIDVPHDKTIMTTQIVVAGA